MIVHIPDLVDAGIDSFKIEGRMKTALYVADVARTYRQAIDDYFESPKLYESKKDYYMEEISKCTYRQFTTGFFYGPTTHETQIYDNNTYVRGYVFLGIIREVDEEGYALIEQKNKFCVGDEIEIMKPSGENVTVKVLDMKNEKGEKVEIGLNMEEDVNTIITLSKDMIGATDETVIDTLGKLSEYDIYVEDINGELEECYEMMHKEPVQESDIRGLVLDTVSMFYHNIRDGR